VGGFLRLVAGVVANSAKENKSAIGFSKTCATVKRAGINPVSEMCEVGPGPEHERISQLELRTPISMDLILLSNR
jgi:hypothetical protein